MDAVTALLNEGLEIAEQEMERRRGEVNQVPIAKNTLALGVLLLLAGCSTHRVSLVYAEHAIEISPAPSAVAIGQFSDGRGKDARRGDNNNWFAVIRGGYGKTLLTAEPLNVVVAKAFSDGLAARKMLAATPENTAYLLFGEIKEFACEQYVRRSCHIAIEVIVSKRAGGQQVFKRISRADGVEGSLLAIDTGMFGSVDKLKEFSATSLSQVVDRAIDDPALRDAIKPQSANP
jgi:hypothetical protein